MSFELAAQKAVYDRLSGEVTATVFDVVPAQPEGMPADSFPYVVIGEQTVARWDRDDKTGAVVTVTLHVWSRFRGTEEAKAIMAEIETRLHRQALTHTGFTFIDCLHEFGSTMDDPDGNLRHGITRYRLTIERN